jgi:hypothetical protein
MALGCGDENVPEADPGPVPPKPELTLTKLLRADRREGMKPTVRESFVLACNSLATQVKQEGGINADFESFALTLTLLFPIDKRERKAPTLLITLALA